MFGFLRAFTVSLLLVPTLAQAASVMTWDFTNANVPGRWEGAGLQTTPATDGLHIQAQDKGFMVRPLDPRPIDSIEITYTSAVETEALLLWHTSDLAEGDLVQLPFTLEQSTFPTTTVIDVSSFPGWDSSVSQFGFALPAGATVTIQHFDFVSLNLLEKSVELFKGFWRFDSYRAYTVNFLWGPRLSTTAAARDYMFNRLPPLAPSANSVFYLVFALAIGLAVLQTYRQVWSREKAIATVLLTGAVLWGVYDLRMGAEVIHYAVDDYQTYWSQTGEDRRFRDRGVFYAFAEQVKDTLSKEKDYVLLLSVEAPYRSLMRYLTYPAAPLSLEEAREDVRYWVIVDRRDLSLSEDSRLVLNGEAISPPGEIVDVFSPGIFLFDTQP